MSTLKRLASGLHEDESGVALLEYTILLGIIAVAVISTIVTVGAWTTGQWGAFCNALPGHGTC